MPLAAIRSLVKEDLELTDQFILSQLDANLPLVKQIIEYILSCGGKRVRPLVLLLSAKALNHPGQAHIQLASVIELIHTATLLHDDVVDQSSLRRGHKTAHTIWGSTTSVLIGDLLYSKAFQIVVDLKNQDILTLFAKATPFIAEGEIMQLINCNNPDTTEHFYFEIIHRKTAKLFEVAAELGAHIADDSDKKETMAMRHYGFHLGLAYQLIDDALDYSQSAASTGKDIGQDIAEGKATLPIIYAMRKCDAKEAKRLREIIKTGSFHKLENILNIIESTKAIKYTADAAKEHARRAKRALATITTSPYRKALEELSDFVVERNY